MLRRAAETTLKPTISAILPVYNGEGYLRASMASVISQSLPPVELFVIDDGSSDRSLEIARSIETPFPKHVLQQKNGRQSAARNLAAASATGKYLAFLDHDDLWHPHHLERLVAPMEADARIGWTYSDIDEIDEQGRLVSVGALRELNPEVQHPKTDIFNMLRFDMFIFPSASVVRRDAFAAVGGFDERLSGYEDDDLFLRLFRAGCRNAFLSEPLVSYRRHGNSSTYSERMWVSRDIFAAKLIESFPDDRSLLRYYVRDIIAPRFYATAKREYFRHFPEQRWDLCDRALDLMVKYSELSALPMGTPLLLRTIGFQVLRHPRFFQRVFPLLKRAESLRRFW